MQILQRERFVAGYQSMDIDTLAYDITKQAFYDGRIKRSGAPAGAEGDAPRSKST